MTDSFQRFMEFAVDGAWQAGKITLEYFQTTIAVDRKKDNSPVTIADRRSEEHLRAMIQARFPDHGILGEEFGESHASSPYRWILDPIDGTSAFIRGVPIYGVLIGLEVHDECVVGVAHFPALGEMVYAAKGEGCFWNGRRVHASEVKDFSEALILTTNIKRLAHDRREAYDKLLLAPGGESRTWGDCYGHILVATGRAEVMLDPAMNVWDCAALKPIVEEAGGTFTDWNGVATIRGGSAISTNGKLFEKVMEMVR
ncbi:MAG: histidinol-phosphatase [Candidatus Tectomicrobia bacterium]|nr:histidinol-phosphatase [Candidatus Tectomicrobia bacterium]